MPRQRERWARAAQVGASCHPPRHRWPCFGGLPGAGKIRVARKLGVPLRGAVVRVDEVEAPRRRSGIRRHQPTACVVAQTVAEGCLHAGAPIIVDAGNPAHQAVGRRHRGPAGPNVAAGDKTKPPIRAVARKAPRPGHSQRRRRLRGGSRVLRRAYLTVSRLDPRPSRCAASGALGDKERGVTSPASPINSASLGGATVRIGRLPLRPAEPPCAHAHRLRVGRGVGASSFAPPALRRSPPRLALSSGRGSSDGLRWERRRRARYFTSSRRSAPRRLLAPIARPPSA
jgi:hypothetical protein